MTTFNKKPVEITDYEEEYIDSLLEDVLRNSPTSGDGTKPESRYIVTNGEGEVYYRLNDHMLFGIDEVAVLTLGEAYEVIAHVKKSDGKVFLYRLVMEEINDDRSL